MGLLTNEIVSKPLSGNEQCDQGSLLVLTFVVDLKQDAENITKQKKIYIY
jgi:hypothetical protein